MNFNLSVHKNAFHPHLNAEHLMLPCGKSVNEVLIERSLLVDVDGSFRRTAPFVVMLNGSALLQADWNTLMNPEDVLQVIHMPKGGGGGGSAMGVVMGLLAAALAYFTFGLSLTVSVAIGAAVAVGSTLLLRSAVPAPPSTMAGVGRATSSTYDLKAQGNQAKLNEAMPRVYGTMRTFPDLATRSYSEYESNQQILFQLFCVSLGDVDVDSIALDDTPIANFSDAQYEVIKPGGVVTLFPDVVIVSSAVNGIELLAPNHPDWVTPTAFVISPTEEINLIAIDISNPRGVGRVDTSPEGGGATLAFSVQVRGEYRDLSESTSPWIDMGIPASTFATQNPQVRTHKVKVPLGRYEVRVYRSSPLGPNGSFDQCLWSGLRGYAPSQRTYGNCTLLATKMRATGALNSTTAGKLTVVSTAKLQAWDPVNGWNAAARTSSIAWAIADILRNTDYGRGLPTSRFNVQNLYRLDQVWAARGDYFNGVFDTSTQLWEAVSTVARCGRATPIYYAGMIDVIREEPQTVVRADFTPAHMVKGSFSSTYNFVDENSPDHILVEYTDIGLGWVQEEVECALPDSPRRNPIKVALKGCTDRAQAHREGMSIVASNRDRRRTIEFTCLTPGLIPTYNSLCRVSHDVPSWGYSGRVLSFTPSNGRMITSEPVPFNESGVWMAAFRKRDGSEDGPYTITQLPDYTEDLFGFIVQASVEDRAKIYISDGSREDYTTFIAGPSERRGMLVLIQSVNPDAEGRVKISAINAANSVHTAENDATAPPPTPGSNLPSVDALPIVDSVNVVYTVEVGRQSVIATVSRHANYYEFEAKPGDGSWQRLGAQDSPTMTTNLSPGEWSVRVRGVGKVEGPWATWTGTIEATSLPTVTLTAFTTTTKLFAIGLAWTWDPNNTSIADSIEIRAGLTNVLGNSTVLVTLPYPANRYTHDGLGLGSTFFYWARCRDTAGRWGAWFNAGEGTPGSSDASGDNILDAVDGKIGEEQLTQELLQKINTPTVDLGPLWAAVEQEQTERIEGDTALAQAVTTTSAKADDAYALTQITQQSLADLNEDLSAMITIKAELDIDGEPYIAAIGVGVDNTEGVITRSITMVGDKLTFIDPSNGSKQTLMQLTSDGLVVRSAFIGKATITQALIGETITSVDTVLTGGNAGLSKMEQNFQQGKSTYRGVEFTNIIDDEGTRLIDVASGIVVFQAGKI